MSAIRELLALGRRDRWDREYRLLWARAARAQSGRDVLERAARAVLDVAGACCCSDNDVAALRLIVEDGVTSEEELAEILAPTLALLRDRAP